MPTRKSRKQFKQLEQLYRRRVLRLRKGRWSNPRITQHIDYCDVNVTGGLTGRTPRRTRPREDRCVSSND
ncbi:hypothetical protein TNIN_48281 [Trichonephila inaurata madagascariensis]|uniref:Uncharacterized protein n=1 Tax=Trichonephila inaurata madagascariensis TaxID=2747483 RepID=A0A8X7CP47_9ARAC|nr:hypothetical protein TNIN_48281 [Trichonephila inaurata madagascariensis]